MKRNKMKNNDLMLITKQGSPVVNVGCVVSRSKNLCAVEIDMLSKHCEITSTFGSNPAGTIGINVGANRNSLYLMRGKKKSEDTSIEFPAFTGWRIFSCEIVRYTMRICFLRVKKPILPNTVKVVA